MNGSEMLIAPASSGPLSARSDDLAAAAPLRAAQLQRRARPELALPFDDDALARLEPLADDRLIADGERDVDRPLHGFVVGPGDIDERALRPALHRRRRDDQRGLARLDEQARLDELIGPQLAIGVRHLAL